MQMQIMCFHVLFPNPNPIKHTSLFISNSKSLLCLVCLLHTPTHILIMAESYPKLVNNNTIPNEIRTYKINDKKFT